MAWTCNSGKYDEGLARNLRGSNETLRATSVEDPGSRILCLFYPWIRDMGWVKSQDPDPG
jgi:hypothetical protein